MYIWSTSCHTRAEGTLSLPLSEDNIDLGEFCYHLPIICFLNFQEHKQP